MELNPLFVPAALLTGYIAYQLYKRHKSTKSGTVGKKHDTKKKQVRVLRHYTEPSDAQIDPLNMTSNVTHNRLIKTERGPNGVPRKIYEGAGGGQITLYGHNYHAL